MMSSPKFDGATRWLVSCIVVPAVAQRSKYIRLNLTIYGASISRVGLLLLRKLGGNWADICRRMSVVFFTL